MFLKVHRKHPDGWERQLNTRDPETGKLVDPRQTEGVCLNLPEFDYMEVVHTGTKPKQNFSTGLVQRGIREGWLTMSKDKLVLHTKPEELVYDVVKGPGRYCCHCGEKLDDDAIGELAQTHVLMNHEGVESPDKGNPSGYVMRSSYKGILSAGQHAKWTGQHDELRARNVAHAGGE